MLYRWSYCPTRKLLFAFAMRRVLAAELAELFEFQLVGGLLFVLGSGVILPLALGAIQADDDAHGKSLKLRRARN
jgi:hypothetical protein